MIGTKCNKCGKSYKLKDTAAGKSINCECGNVVVVPLEPNLDENGERIKPSKLRQKAIEEARAEGRDLNKEMINGNVPEKEVKSIANKREGSPDLSNKKICSKCKNIFNLDIKECPRCGFNTMGVKYDQTKREETSRKVSQRIFLVGKYAIPIAILIGLIYLFNLQMNNLEGMREFEKKIVAKIMEEKNKMALAKKSDPNANSLVEFSIAEDERYFIAVPKNTEKIKFSFFGNGYFTLKKPGICYEVRFEKGFQKSLRYYVEDENGNPTLINKRDYDLHEFESIAFKVAF